MAKADQPSCSNDEGLSTPKDGSTTRARLAPRIGNINSTKDVNRNSLGTGERCALRKTEFSSTIAITAVSTSDDTVMAGVGDIDIPNAIHRDATRITQSRIQLAQCSLRFRHCLQRPP